MKYLRYHLLIKSNMWNFDASWSWVDLIVLNILLVHFILRNCLIWQPPSQDFVAGVYWLTSVRVLLNLQWYSRCCCCWCWGGACESYWTSCRSNRSWLCFMVNRKEKADGLRRLRVSIGHDSRISAKKLQVFHLHLMFGFNNLMLKLLINSANI